MDETKQFALPSVQEQNKQHQLKKLYFKPSSTEALHSAILLKARNSNRLFPTPKATNLNTLLSISSNSCLNSENNQNFIDELDSPFKIKENLSSSIKNLKADPLRSSTSDDEDSHSDNLDRKTKIQADNLSDIIILSEGVANASQTPSQQQPVQRNIYLRANPNNYNIKQQSNNPILLNKAINNNYVIAQFSSNNRAGSKRGKEEALSNSSSSDEEDLNNQKQQKQPALNHPQRPIITPVISQATKYNNLLSVHMTNNAAQSYITPVVSSNASQQGLNYNLEPELINSPSSMSSTSSSFCSSSSSPSSASSKSQKSFTEQDFDSKFTIASPISCCSSTTTNDGNIDLTDDNSSTASGPIYVRQPGFEYHAHEVQQQNAKLSTLKNFVINTDNNNRGTCRVLKAKKCESFTVLSNLKQQANSVSTGSLPIAASSPNSTANTNNKAKKKLCTVTNDSLNDSSSNDSTTQTDPSKQNIQLKPISNKSKRDPLPMRLRALPPSFWQQPNQPNVSPGTMYLPPLFKNEIENASDETNDEQKQDNLVSREVRISAANPDLLFKLFENIESSNKDKKQVQQLLLQSQYRTYKNQKASTKALSKALIKGEDPCIVDAVTEGLFPQLKLETRNETLHYLSIKGESSTLNCLNLNGLSASSPMINFSSLNGALPLIQLEQNYSQALSEVVAAL